MAMQCKEVNDWIMLMLMLDVLNIVPRFLPSGSTSTHVDRIDNIY